MWYRTAWVQESPVVPHGHVLFLYRLAGQESVSMQSKNLQKMQILPAVLQSYSMLQLRRKIKPAFRILAAPKASVPYIRCQLRSRQSTETAHSVEKRKQPALLLRLHASASRQRDTLLGSTPALQRLTCGIFHLLQLLFSLFLSFDCLKLIYCIYCYSFYNLLYHVNNIATMNESHKNPLIYLHVVLLSRFDFASEKKSYADSSF